jgi:quinol monooxygenase YgiN
MLSSRTPRSRVQATRDARLRRTARPLRAPRAIGRPGHFAVIETWRDQKAFDAREAAAQKQFLDTLRPIRVSDYDQRPYKTLTVGPAPPASNGQAISVVAHVDTVAAPQAPALLKRLAEASRREDGNVRFDVLQHMMRANHFTVVETWQKKALARAPPPRTRNSIATSCSR